MNSRIYHSKNENETLKIAELFTQDLKSGDVILMSGDLGAGKTTFTQGIAKSLGVKSRILSPTFSLLRSHTTTNHQTIKHLHHIDLYRIEDQTTVNEIILDLKEQNDSIIIIEWPKDFDLPQTWRLHFSNTTPREITIKKHD